MRRTKLYQLMAVAGCLSTAVATTPVLAKPGGTTVVPLDWTAGTATVDGDISEWDLATDASTKMCEAGSVDSSGNCDGKVQLSTLYARYNCDTNTMYVLVLKKEADHTADGDRWVKIYDLSNSEQDIDIADVSVGGVSQGYEASFALAAGTYSNVQVHINIDGGRTSSTGKNGTTRSITVPASCEMPVSAPVDDPPVDDTPVDDTPVDDTPVDDTPVDDTPVDDTPVDDTPVDDTPVDDTPVDDTPVDNGGGNPNMLCSEIMGSNGAPMSLIDKFEWSGNSYAHESGTGAISVDGDASGGAFSSIGTVKVAAVIVKGGTVALVDQDGNDSFSNAGLTNKGGQTADISNIQFCQEGVFDSAGAEVCLWSANKDADGNYINIEQVGCVDAEKGKFYAIEAAGEFSNALEAE